MLKVKRRDVIRVGVAAGIAASWPIPARSASPSASPVGEAHPLMRAIPKTGEQIPIIGMGTWQTFNVGRSAKLRAGRVEVLRAFFAGGGGMIDSSPMYGSSEAVVGHCLDALDAHPNLFAATKVWTPSTEDGLNQMTSSEQLWAGQKIGKGETMGVGRTMDLQQIHNLLNWEDHWKTLSAAKAEGRIRYTGITTSHGRRLDDLAAFLKTHDVDFVQFTYNIEDRWAERDLLSIAQDRGVAVILNRPFGGGGLFRRVANKSLPGVAAELGIENWAQYFLKFAISHPAVTCAIPATSQVDHMVENMGAAQGALPDAATRKQMAKAWASV